MFIHGEQIAHSDIHAHEVGSTTCSEGCVLQSRAVKEQLAAVSAFVPKFWTELQGNGIFLRPFIRRMSQESAKMGARRGEVWPSRRRLVLRSAAAVGRPADDARKKLPLTGKHQPAPALSVKTFSIDPHFRRRSSFHLSRLPHPRDFPHRRYSPDPEREHRHNARRSALTL